MSSLSVAILGKNSRWILDYSLRAVRSALREVGRDVEVVYVDGGSTDGSKELVREVLPQARIIDAPGTNIPEARNIAVKETSGEYLVCWDSDISAPPSALKALLQQDKPIVALMRRDVYVASEEEIQNIMAGLSDDQSPTAYPVSFVVFSVTLFHRDVQKGGALRREDDAGGGPRHMPKGILQGLPKLLHLHGGLRHKQEAAERRPCNYAA